MDTAVAIKDGYYIVDAQAWVNQRVGDIIEQYTASLRVFLTTNVVGDDYYRRTDASTRMQLWCAARDWTVGHGMPLYHDKDSFDEPITVVLATDPAHTAHALVQVGTDEPDVYHDLTTDDAYWLQTEPVEIICPAGHRWTWLDRTSLIDEHGIYLPVADLFGPGRHAPYSRCHGCVAYDDGERADMCRCDNSTVIYCPTCGQRCRLDLTDIPTHDQPAGQR